VANNRLFHQLLIFNTTSHDVFLFESASVLTQLAPTSHELSSTVIFSIVHRERSWEFSRAFSIAARSCSAILSSLNIVSRVAALQVRTMNATFPASVVKGSPSQFP